MSRAKSAKDAKVDFDEAENKDQEPFFFAVCGAAFRNQADRPDGSTLIITAGGDGDQVTVLSNEC